MIPGCVFRRFPFAVALAFLIGAGASIEAVAAPLNLRVMSFNIKNGNPSRENSWEVRRPILARTIQLENPDLIGTQETFFFQAKDIEKDSPQYAFVALGRAGGSKDEMMAIFYKRDRFEVMAYDHFWLSDTPDVIGSRTWGHDNRRMVTWVRFKELESGREFYHWNTHFDHEVQEAREKSADLIVQRIRAIQPMLPIVVTGDFNADQDNVVHTKLLATDGASVSLRDAWDLATTREGTRVGTFHGWRNENDNMRRIDWVLVSPEITCTRATVVIYDENGQRPSDHYPVVCDLILGE